MKLDWLPEFLASNVTTTASPSTLVLPNIAPILDTILIFARARTSALHGLEHWSVCRKLIAHLNSVLASVGASYHRVELVRRGPAQFFITCTNSPRFSWDKRLTHRVIGQNLDYFAPGHITTDPHTPRGSILFIEKQSLKVLLAELVILSALDEPNIHDEMQSFSDAKEELFNHSMTMLGLSHRFKWVFNTSATRDAIAEIMMASVPPSSVWWESNCYFANGFGFPSLVQEAGPFCGFASHYELWWPTIQTTFQFILKYKRVELWFSSPATALPYWTAMGDLFERIKAATESISDAAQMTSLADDFKVQLNLLAKQVDDSTSYQFNDIASPQTLSASPWTSFCHRCYVWLQWCILSSRSVWESIKLHVFERYKLREPLVRKGIWVPPNTIGDHFLFH